VVPHANLPSAQISNQSSSPVPDPTEAGTSAQPSPAPLIQTRPLGTPFRIKVPGQEDWAFPGALSDPSFQKLMEEERNGVAARKRKEDAAENLRRSKSLRKSKKADKAAQRAARAVLEAGAAPAEGSEAVNDQSDDTMHDTNVPDGRV